MASNYPTSLDSFTNPSASSLLTSPSHAQQHADINDAMEAVQTKLAIGNTVIGTYTAFTPTLTNVTTGNATRSGAYCRVNDFVHVYGSYVFGSTTVVTGSIYLNLPININANHGSWSMVGVISIADASSSTNYQCFSRWAGVDNLVRVGVLNTTGTYATWATAAATVPMTWTTGDILNFNLYYRAV
jgi:hypothetical protein